MNVIDMMGKPSRVFISNVPVGEPFISDAGCLYIRCSVHGVPGVQFPNLEFYAFHVQTGQVVCFSVHEEVVRVEAETIIRATL